MSFTTAGNNASHYSQVDRYTGVIEADSHQLVQMLLEGALGRIAVAKGLISHHETAKKGEAIGKVISIIGGLRSSLDMDAGGDIATNLDNLYEYMERQLVRANLENSIDILDEVASLLREIKTGWESIRSNAKAAVPEANLA